MERKHPGHVAVRAIDSHRRHLGFLLAALAFVISTLVVTGALNPWKTSAQSANCSNVANQLRLPIATCTFTNSSAGTVNDIHIVFDRIVIKLSSNPASQCTDQLILRQGVLKTALSCRWGSHTSGILPAGAFSLTVLYSQRGGPNIESWYWTLNGTPIAVTPAATAAATNTPRPTSTNTPRPTSTNTPRPTSTNTPRPTSTNTPRPTSTNTPRPTSTNTPTPTDTPVPLAETPTDTPTETPNATPEFD